MDSDNRGSGVRTGLENKLVAHHVDQLVLGPDGKLLHGCHQGRLGVGALHAAVIH